MIATILVVAVMVAIAGFLWRTFQQFAIFVLVFAALIALHFPAEWLLWIGLLIGLAVAIIASAGIGLAFARGLAILALVLLLVFGSIPHWLWIAGIIVLAILALRWIFGTGSSLVRALLVAVLIVLALVFIAPSVQGALQDHDTDFHLPLSGLELQSPFPWNDNRLLQWPVKHTGPVRPQHVVTLRMEDPEVFEDQPVVIPATPEPTASPTPKATATKTPTAFPSPTPSPTMVPTHTPQVPTATIVPTYEPVIIQPEGPNTPTPTAAVTQMPDTGTGSSVQPTIAPRD